MMMLQNYSSVKGNYSKYSFLVIFLTYAITSDKNLARRWYGNRHFTYILFTYCYINQFLTNFNPNYDSSLLWPFELRQSTWVWNLNSTLCYKFIWMDLCNFAWQEKMQQIAFMQSKAKKPPSAGYQLCSA